MMIRNLCIRVFYYVQVCLVVACCVEDAQARSLSPAGKERVVISRIAIAGVIYSDENQGKNADSWDEFDAYFDWDFEVDKRKLVFVPPEHILGKSVIAMLPADAGIVVGYRNGDIEYLSPVEYPKSSREVSWVGVLVFGISVSSVANLILIAWIIVWRRKSIKY